MIQNCLDRPSASIFGRICRYTFDSHLAYQNNQLLSLSSWSILRNWLLNRRWNCTSWKVVERLIGRPKIFIISPKNFISQMTYGINSGLKLIPLVWCKVECLNSSCPPVINHPLMNSASWGSLCSGDQNCWNFHFFLFFGVDFSILIETLRMKHYIVLCE